MTRAVAIADFVAETNEEVSVPSGASLEVVNIDEDGWCTILYEGQEGLFPSNFLSYDLPAEASEEANKIQNEPVETVEKELSEEANETEKSENETENDNEPANTDETVEEEPEKTEEKVEETPEERAIRKEAQRVKQRKNIINEIRATESDYVKDLSIIVNIFTVPLQSEGIISQQDNVALFSNIMVLLNVNQKLDDEITANPDDETIQVGKIFVGMADFFKMYTAYCANQPKAMEALDRLGRNAAFKGFTDKAMLNPDCRGLTLFSFLIKPIQRICKYPLLLKDLLRNTPDDHPDHENLVTALSKIEEVVAYVNERKRLAENLQKILDVSNQIEANEELSLVSPSRRFVREGNFTVFEKSHPRSRTVYLFNDLLVMTKPKRNNSGKDHFKYQLSLNDAKIIDVADTEDVQNACEIRPKECDDKKEAYVIVFANADDKKSWVKEIKALVKEFQRKQYLESQRIAAEGGPPLALEPEPDKIKKRSKLTGSRRDKRCSSTSSPLSKGSSPSKASSTRKNTASIVGSPFGSWRSKKDPQAEKSPKSPAKVRPTSIKNEKALKKDIAKSLKTQPKPPKSASRKGKSTVSKSAPVANVNTKQPNINADFSAQLAAKLAQRPK